MHDCVWRSACCAVPLASPVVPPLRASRLSFVSYDGTIRSAAHMLHQSAVCRFGLFSKCPHSSPVNRRKRAVYQGAIMGISDKTELKPRKYVIVGGQGGIRTHGELAPSLVFKTSSLNHSDTCPSLGDARLNRDANKCKPQTVVHLGRMGIHELV